MHALWIASISYENKRPIHPMHVFKYFDKEHEEAFVSHGQVRVGTIHEYRQTEDKARHDHADGMFSFLFMTTDEAIELTSDQANAITYDYVIKEGVRLKIMPNSGFSSNLIVPNSYIYCGSNVYSDMLRHKFGGGCFRIRNVKVFGQILFEELSKRQEMLFWVSERVTYVATKIIRVTNDNKEKVIPKRKFKEHPLGRVRDIQLEDYFSKTIVPYQVEDEYRFVFVPKKPPILEEQIIRSPAITAACKLL
jgi:hypothetical protein